MADFDPTILQPIDGRHAAPDQRTTLGNIISATTGWTTPQSLENQLRQEGLLEVFDPNWRETPEYKRYANTDLGLYFAGRSPEAAAMIGEYFDQRLEFNREMSKGTIGQRLLGTVLGDPFIALEVGLSLTPAGRLRSGGSLLARTLSTGAVAGGITGSVEALRQGYLLQADPTHEIESAAFMVAAATTLGAVLGGALGVPGVRAEMAAEEAYAAMGRLRDFAMTLRSDPQYRGTPMQGVQVDVLADYAPRNVRPLGAERDPISLLEEKQRLLTNVASTLKYKMSEAETAAVTSRIETLTSEARNLRREILFRRIDEAGLSQDISKIFRPSGAADNPILMHTPGPLRWVMRSELPNKTKLQFLKLVDSTGIQMRLHEYGITLGPSVENLIRTDFGAAAAALDDLDIIYRQRFNLSAQGENIFAGRDVNLESLARRPSGEDFDSWITEVNRRRILGEQQAGELEEVAARRLTKYFEDWEKKLVDADLLHTKKLLLRRNKKMQDEIRQLNERIAQGAPAATMRPRINQLTAEIQKNQGLIDARKAIDNKYGKEVFFPRRWNVTAIKRDRQRFEAILRQHYLDNPTVPEWVIVDPFTQRGEWKVKTLSTDLNMIDQRVKHTVDGILGLRNPIAADALDQIEAVTAVQKARSVGYRQLDIPNREVIDFINLDVRSGVREYNSRVARRYRFAEQFGNLEKALNALEASMAGVSPAMQQEARKNFVRLYNRISGRILEDPTAMNQRVAQFLRDSASFAYLGSAGFAAVADFGKVIAEFDNTDLILGLKSAFDKELRNASIRETRIAGSAAEMAAHTTMARITGDMYMEGGVNAFMQKLRAGFNVLNLLGPVTVAGKLFTGMLSGHRLIETSIKVANGTATRKEIAMLARYNIGIEQARKIANMPWERTENGLILPNTEAWDRYAPAMYNGKRYDIRIVPDTSSSTTSGVVAGQYQPIVSVRHLDGLDQTRLRQIEDEVSNGNYGELARADESLKGERAARYVEARENIKTGDLEAETIRVYELSEAQLIDLYGALANVNVIEIDTARALVTTTQRNVVGLHRGYGIGGNIPGDIYLNTPVAIATYDTTIKMASRMKNDPAYLQSQYDLAASGDELAIHMIHFYENMGKIENVEDFIDFVFFHEVAHGIKTSDAWVFANKTSAEKEIAADDLGLQMFSARKSKLFKEELTAHFRAKQMLEMENYSVGEIKIDRDYIEANVWPNKPWAKKPGPIDPLPPVREGYVRLYRAEYAGPRRNIPDWITQGQDASGHTEAAGRWFVEDRSMLDFYLNDIGEHGAVFYVDVPEEVAARSRVSSTSETVMGRTPASFSKDPENEFFLPREFADVRERVPDPKPAPKGPDPMHEDTFKDVDEYVYFLALREVVRIDKKIGDRPTVRQIDLLNREALKALRSTEKGARDIVDTFRAAIEAEGSSTVIAATAGERPLMMDGVLHVREDGPLAFLGRVDHMTPGYVRIENGFIGLPLQFYSFAFAGVNKVTGQFLQNSVRNRVAGLAAMFAFGYMISKSRTPDFVWEKMQPQDRLAKAFDQSGIAALYSDTFYTLMQLGNTGFGVNISGGMFAPRFREDPNALDAITGITGASSGWALGMGRAAYNVATGNFGEGAAEFTDNMLFQNMWLWKSDMNELSRWFRG